MTKVVNKDTLFWSAALALLIAIIFAGCGKEIVYVDKDGKPVKPVDPTECLPKAVADAGPNMHIAHDQDPTVILPFPDRAQIGALKSAEGLTCSWAPTMGLSDANACQPIAMPKDTTLYILTVKSLKCGTEAKSPVTVNVYEQKKRGEPETIEIDGETYHTGYNEFWRFADHYRATYVHARTGYYSAMKFAADTIDLTPPSFHVNRQPRGSCWAEGGRSAGEATYHYVTKTHTHVSTQRIIDCSGYGSAAGGGQISTGDLVSHGLVRETDYPYTGYDQKCRRDIPSFHKANRDFFLKSADGNSRPKLSDLLQAHYAFGASEDCGSAGALGSGGYIGNNGGRTDHCWSGFGILLHPDGGYCRLGQNSWGPKWGGETPKPGLHPGQFCAKFASDGSISSGIMAEIKFVDMGSPCPPPKVDAGPDKTIVLDFPGLSNFAVIGTEHDPVTREYEWTVVTGDLTAEIVTAKEGFSIVRPNKTTRFRLTVKDKCATAHAEVTVTVWGKDVTGRTVEIK